MSLALKAEGDDTEWELENRGRLRDGARDGILASDFLFCGGATADLIRGADWSKTPLGSFAFWPPPLRIALGMITGSGIASCIGWGRDLIALPNDAYVAVTGQVLTPGQRMGEAWGESWVHLEDLYRAAADGRPTFAEDVSLFVHKGAGLERAFFTIGFNPIRDEKGRVVGVVNTAIETTKKVLGERRRDYYMELEEFLRQPSSNANVAQVVPAMLGAQLGVDRVGYCEIREGWRAVRFQRDWCRGGANPSPSADGDLETLFGEELLALIRAGQVLRVEDCEADARISPMLAEAWKALGCRSFMVAPLRRDGAVAGVVFVGDAVPRHWPRLDGVLLQVSAERAWAAMEVARTAVAIRENEARFSLALKAARLGTWELDLRTGLGRRAGAFAQELPFKAQSGYDFSEVTDPIHPDDRERFVAGIEAVRTGRTDRFEAEIRARKPGANDWTWVGTFGAVVERCAETGEPLRMSGVAHNITERKTAQEKQMLLMREVNHRSKNALAIVQSMLLLTKAPDVPSFAKTVSGRVAALARAQTALAEQSWSGASLLNLLEGELTPFLSGQRVDLSGGDLILSAVEAQALGMAMHELATNAAKHGALSVEGGRVSVSWLLDGGGPESIRLCWREQGGPAVTGPPARRGFGSRVLDGTVRSQLGGELSLVWAPGGLVCEMTLPRRFGAAGPAE